MGINEKMVLYAIVAFLVCGLASLAIYYKGRINRLTEQIETVNRENKETHMMAKQIDQNLADIDIKLSTEVTALNNRTVSYRNDEVHRDEKLDKRISRLEDISGNLEKVGDLADTVRFLQNHIRETDAVMEVTRQAVEQAGKLAMTNQDAIDVIRKELRDDEVDG